jgi:hypothetical protein
MIVDYPPKLQSVYDFDEFNEWMERLVDELRFPDRLEVQSFQVQGEATLQNFNVGYIGGWQVTESTIERGVVIIDAATPKITVDDIVIDGANNRITVADKILLDADTERIDVGDTGGTYIQIDGANTRIRSSNYVTGYAGAGFTLESDLLEVGNIACRGIFRTAVFQKDVISAVGGNVAVTKSADVLDADMTAADASTLTIEGNVTFAANDILRIKDGTDDEWLEVTNVASAPTYTVTRDKAADYAANTNPAWKKGATVVNYGASGDGGLFMTASETNAPYMSVFTHAGSPWSTLTTKLRVGNLNGFAGYSSDTYGLAIYEDASNYLKFDPTNGIQISVSAADALTVKSGGDIKIESGGDINLVGHDSDAGALNFTGTSKTSTITTDTAGNNFFVDTSNITIRNSTGPAFRSRYTGTPGSDFVLGTLYFNGKNSASEYTDYVQIVGRTPDVTDGTEDGSLQIRGLCAGADNVAFLLGMEGNLTLTAPDGSANLILIRADSSPSDNDICGRIYFKGPNDAAEDINYWQLRGLSIDVSDGTEDGRLQFYGILDGSEHLAYYFDADGTAYADESWETFSPDITQSKTIKGTGPHDYLAWALEDAKKPVKPYRGLYDKDNIPVGCDVSSAEEERRKYAKSPAKIAIGVTRWAEDAERRISELTAKVKELEGKQAAWAQNKGLL